MKGDFHLHTSIMDKMSVAVDAAPNENIRVYGTFRFVKYAYFLLRCCYPMHNMLCQASEGLLCEYVKGDAQLKDVICMIENKLNKYDKEFFGI